MLVKQLKTKEKKKKANFVVLVILSYSLLGNALAGEVIICTAERVSTTGDDVIHVGESFWYLIVL